MPGQVQTLQVANPAQSTVSRMPQTTAQPTTPSGAAPFTRLSRQGQILGPQQAGMDYGELWTPTLKPVGGYLRYLSYTINTQNQAGENTGLLADFPFNTIQNLFLRDPFGQPILQADGFSLALAQMYGGQRGMLGYGNDPGNNPSFVPPSMSPSGADFWFNLNLPLEMDSSGYCSLASMNAASQPQLQVQLNPIGVVYDPSAQPTTPGTLTNTVNEPFWMAPVDNPQIAPPDVGSSAQWSVTRAQTLISSSAFQRIVLPRVGTFIHTLIGVLRDTGTTPVNQRVNAWPESDLSLWVDGVPITFELLSERLDTMFHQFGAWTWNPDPNAPSIGKAPTGVIAYSFRESVQTAVSTADTYDLLLPTTPATLLEMAGTWGVFAGVGQLYIVTGELFPVSGIPYTHLTA